MKEHEKARAWREARGLTVDQLADLSGYSPITIYWYERGETPPSRGTGSRDPKPWVWQRYRLACAAVDHQLATGKEFAW